MNYFFTSLLLLMSSISFAQSDLYEESKTATIDEMADGLRQKFKAIIHSPETVKQSLKVGVSIDGLACFRGGKGRRLRQATWGQILYDKDLTLGIGLPYRSLFALESELNAAIVRYNYSEWDKEFNAPVYRTRFIYYDYIDTTLLMYYGNAQVKVDKDMNAYLRIFGNKVEEESSLRRRGLNVEDVALYCVSTDVAAQMGWTYTPPPALFRLP